MSASATQGSHKKGKGRILI